MNLNQFLEQQSSGQRVDEAAAFTIHRSRSRDEILASMPQTAMEPIFRLLDAAVLELDPDSPSRVSQVMGSGGEYPCLALHLPTLPAESVEALLQELRHPFGQVPGVTKLAKAIFRAVMLQASVSLNWKSGSLAGLTGRDSMHLDSHNLRVPERLAEPSEPGLRLVFYHQRMRAGYGTHKLSIARKVHKYRDTPERLLPLEACSKRLEGAFELLSRPFTAIRSYAQTPQAEGSRIRLDLWEGPYTKLHEKTLLLDKREPRKLFFLRWRPNYGRPTLLHHFLDRPAEFGEQDYGATFWVETTQRPAQVHLFSGHVVSDPVEVRGPKGLVGLVCWPKLTFDIWGTELVQNDRYETAVQWIQEQVDATAHCLSEHLDLVLERVLPSRLSRSKNSPELRHLLQKQWGPNG